MYSAFNLLYLNGKDLRALPEYRSVKTMFAMTGRQAPHSEKMAVSWAVSTCFIAQYGTVLNHSNVVALLDHVEVRQASEMNGTGSRRPTDSPDAAGNLYIADTQNHRIRRVALNGIISTVAGNGTEGDAGDEVLQQRPNCDFPSLLPADYCQLGLSLRPAGVRRDKPACCRGCKSPTGKESSESILASSLADGIARCRLTRTARTKPGDVLLKENSPTSPFADNCDSCFAVPEGPLWAQG